MYIFFNKLYKTFLKLFLIMRLNFDKAGFFTKLYNKTLKVLKCRHFWFLLIIYATLIPRYPNIAGNDSFEILWMAKALVYGLSNTNTWLIHPLSFFGFYPFSFYPILYPFIISIFLRIGFSIQVTATILSILLISIFYIGTIYLSKKISIEKNFQDLFIISLVYAPVFLKFIYNTCGARGPLMAMSSYFFVLVYTRIGNTNRKVSFKRILVFLLLLLLAAFLHRGWIAYIGVLLVFIFALIMSKINVLRRLFVKFINKKSIFIFLYLVTIIICFYFGYIIFGVDFRKIVSPWLNNSSFFGFLINLIIDYGLRIGLISIFFPIGIFISIKEIIEGGANRTIKKGKLDDDSLLSLDEDFVYKSIINLAFILALAFVWTYTTYSTVTFLPIYIIFSIKGLIEISKKIKFSQIIFMVNILSLLFIVLYQFLIISVLPYIIAYIVISLLFILIMTLVIVEERKEPTKKLKFVLFLKKITDRKNIILLIIPVMIFSTVVNDSLLLRSEVKFPYSYISDEEISIINYLNERGVDGIIYVSHHQVSRELSGYGFLPTINGYHSPQQLYYGWINPVSVREYTQINILNFIINPDANYQLQNYEKMLISIISKLNASSIEDLNTLINFHVQYAVILKNSTGSIDTNHYTGYGGIYSSFIDSLRDLPIAFETQHMFVWKFY